jgi:hypothetical protein
MKKLEVDYPWASMRKGDAIFIPTLDEASTKEEGLKTALSFGRFVNHKFGIFDGRLGILFIVQKQRLD